MLQAEIKVAKNLPLQATRGSYALGIHPDIANKKGKKKKQGAYRFVASWIPTSLDSLTF